MATVKTTVTTVTMADVAAAQGGVGDEENDALVWVECPDHYDPMKITAGDIVHDPAIQMIDAPEFAGASVTVTVDPSTRDESREDTQRFAAEAERRIAEALPGADVTVRLGEHGEIRVEADDADRVREIVRAEIDAANDAL